jgi:uncharacterized protein YwgA
MEKSLAELLDSGQNTDIANIPGYREQLAVLINQLINIDFEKLAGILYRIDVSEKKLKKLLSDNPDTDAGLLIADLVIERQTEKKKSRENFRRDSSVSDEEKW